MLSGEILDFAVKIKVIFHTSEISKVIFHWCEISLLIFHCRALLFMSKHTYLHYILLKEINKHLNIDELDMFVIILDSLVYYSGNISLLFIDQMWDYICVHVHIALPIMYATPLMLRYEID